MKEFLFLALALLVFTLIERVSKANDAFEACARGGGTVTVAEVGVQTCTPARRAP